ncbi:lipopolysaccharide assembly protein LapA domain-containing protein [Kordiimonas lacus]|uniref:Lipopolysaccharide assembly protein A domain-containing protein n=1 Tax=Kordiimonas lacus TaxID=637679 RepID=A0A1G6T479_9PROT|nr:lipopolysaccharide assembly protein LapA domain-containing protein [Kordiimonas lacus]SDD23829.1 Protein of unknown function [Kordiimonas lacus]
MAQSLASLIRRIFWILLALFLIYFSVNNRTPVDLRFAPFDVTFAVPAFLLVFVGIFIGLLLAAGVTGWLRLKGFARRRQAERRAAYLEDQVSALAEDAHEAKARRAHDAATLSDGNSEEP